jgi:hypothetical protein
MNITDFIYVSLGNSTGQLQVADAHVQRLVSVVKRATMLEEYITKEKRSDTSFLWAKGLNERDTHKEMFPVHGGKCLS